ncbi:MAG TPA: histidine ammonia-lyase [Candidatus Didemnitutus sp.]|nr:histidine ammonia-lyase [Candidatus Didemnitutus sp.]
MSTALKLDGRKLRLRQLRGVLAGSQRIDLTPAAARRIVASRKRVEAAQRTGRALYGVNTGFGALAHQRVPAADLEKLQQNLILSHAVGVGPEAPPEIVRLMLALKVNGLALGLSGVTGKVVTTLMAFLNADALPVVYTQGSLGASGDLAPLAHLVLPLLGRGEVDFRGKRRPARDVLKRLRLTPIRLQSKEGLGLINGTQFMAAYAVRCLLQLEDLSKLADVSAAMTLEAARGSASPLDPRIHAARRHSGQVASAANLRRLLAGSRILPSHAHCEKVQDPYSIRCVPQVHGAVRLAIDHARRVTETEINSATDNPLVFESGDIVSGGNFHGEPLAFILDYLAIAAAELASIAERRIYMLLHGDTIGDLKVPKLLMRDTGLNSGFMIPQYTAAALVSENKVLAHPASVDSIPSSLGQEDHVSMGAISATKLLTVVRNVETVLAIELMCAAQGLEFLRPLRAGRGVEAAFAAIRRRIPFARADRLFHDDIQTALALVQGGELLRAVESVTGKLR